jgi:hypothetical protein
MAATVGDVIVVVYNFNYAVMGILRELYIFYLKIVVGPKHVAV